MRMVTAIVGLCSLLAQAALAGDVGLRRWTDRLIPLPHEIEVRGSVKVKAGDIWMAPCTVKALAAVTAAERLAVLARHVATTAPKVALRLALADSESGELKRRLAGLPNADQAYAVTSQTEGGVTRISVVGNTPVGMLYGAITLAQLIRTPTNVTEETELEIPLARILDWPDMTERGLWNSAEVVPWFSSLKLNFKSYSCAYREETNGWLKPRVDAVILNGLRRHGMSERVQMIYHLNYLGVYSKRLYELYPELKGKGEAAVPSGESYKFAKRDIANICASQPLWKKIVAATLSEMAAQRARDVSVWLSEFKGQCQCAECLKSSQVELETHLVLDAWREVRRQYPDLVLRVFFSQGDDSAATVRALSSLPPEVKIERVYKLYQPFMNAAAQGQWVLSFSGGGAFATNLRFVDPDQQAQPIKDGYAAKFRGVLGNSGHYIGDSLMPPEWYPRVYDYEASAIAEWSWNVSGRTAREFMEAWGARQAYDEPGRFADWAEIVGSLTSLLTTGKPFGVCWGIEAKHFNAPFRTLAEEVSQRKVFAIYSTQELAQARALYDRALAVATTLNRPEAAVETRWLAAYVNLQEKVTALSGRLAELDPAQRERQREVRDAVRDFKSAAAFAQEAKLRQIELWQDESAAFTRQAGSEILARWTTIMGDLDAAIDKLLKTPGT